jgi:tRNA(adenine34) deaminase
MATKRRWSAKVDTDSTHPEEGLFTKSPNTIAKSLASKKVSPKGPGSGMRMLTFYINRAGKNLPKARKESLEKAKSILSGIIADQKESSAAKHPPKKTSHAAKRTSHKTAGRSAKKAAHSTKRTARKAA